MSTVSRRSVTSISSTGGSSRSAVAEKGKAHAAGLVGKQVSRGRMTQERADAFLARITPTGDAADLAGCDVIVEAVFEDQAVKHRVLSEAERHAEPDALLASNTSTLPITGLAQGLRRQDDVVGMHFFSPVDKMPLVELIVGERTSDAALARAYDVVRQIGKTPIVVQDSRGFFTSRVFGTLVLEGAALLAEGLAPLSIERAALQAGFPAGPLTLLDEVTLTLPLKISDEAKKAGSAENHPGLAVVRRLVEQGRTGKAAGTGFFDWTPRSVCGRGSRSCTRRATRCRSPTRRSGCSSRWRSSPRAASRSGCWAASRTPTSARSWASASRLCTAACCSTWTSTRAGWPVSWPAPTSWPTA